MPRLDFSEDKAMATIFVLKDCSQDQEQSSMTLCMTLSATTTLKKLTSVGVEAVIYCGLVATVTSPGDGHGQFVLANRR